MSELYSNLVRILPDDLAETTAAGVITLNIDKDKPIKGTVLDIGPGKRKDEPMTVAIGDKVALEKNVGQPVEQEDGVFHIIVGEDDILCIL